jgi:hypothetical protein
MFELSVDLCKSLGISLWPDVGGFGKDEGQKRGHRKSRRQTLPRPLRTLEVNFMSELPT